jgi:hypothetical protein
MQAERPTLNAERKMQAKSAIQMAQCTAFGNAFGNDALFVIYKRVTLPH